MGQPLVQTSVRTALIDQIIVKDPVVISSQKPVLNLLTADNINHPRSDKPESTRLTPRNPDNGGHILLAILVIPHGNQGQFSRQPST
ncbi:hypothetical protein [Pseudomonas sp. MWU16-30323]|uniref:hypothetical protein n=1 Tax=Pseudomonas sp. MWU16-30323 TaxID=2878094 RepID=UPI001CFB83DF|nr:hypothetical protein [Pseudomonas sp. MWU16-30323]